MRTIKRITSKMKVNVVRSKKPDFCLQITWNEETKEKEFDHGFTRLTHSRYIVY